MTRELLTVKDMRGFLWDNINIWVKGFGWKQFKITVMVKGKQREVTDLCKHLEVRALKGCIMLINVELDQKLLNCILQDIIKYELAYIKKHQKDQEITKDVQR